MNKEQETYDSIEHPDYYNKRCKLCKNCQLARELGICELKQEEGE